MKRILRGKVISYFWSICRQRRCWQRTRTRGRWWTRSFLPSLLWASGGPSRRDHVEGQTRASPSRLQGPSQVQVRVRRGRQAHEGLPRAERATRWYAISDYTKQRSSTKARKWWAARYNFGQQSFLLTYEQACLSDFKSFFSSFHSQEYFDSELLENWFSKLQEKKWKGSIIFTNLGATWEALNTTRILTEVSSRKFTIMEEMTTQAALMVDINTDKWQRLFAARLLLSIYSCWTRMFYFH